MQRPQTQAGIQIVPKNRQNGQGSQGDVYLRDLSAQKSELHMADPMNQSLLSEDQVSNDLYPDFLNLNSQGDDPNFYNCYKGNEPSRKYLK